MSMKINAARVGRLPRVLLAAGLIGALAGAPIQPARAACSVEVTTASGLLAALMEGKFLATAGEIALSITQMQTTTQGLTNAIVQSSNSVNGVAVQLSDKEAVDGFRRGVAAAVSDVAVKYRPSKATCVNLQRADTVNRTQANFEARRAARATANANYVTGRPGQASAKGPIAVVADTFQNEYLNNGFCDPTTPLPSGLTCNNAGRPPNADLMVSSILDEDISAANPGKPWLPRASELYIKHATPIPPKVPDGDQLALPAGRAQYVAYQSWAAKAGAINWIVTSSAAMGDSADITVGGVNRGRYSYRKALREMAEGKFDDANPFIPDQAQRAMDQDNELGGIQTVAFKVGNVQARLLWQILGKMEQISVANALLLGAKLDEKQPGGNISAALSAN